MQLWCDLCKEPKAGVIQTLIEPVRQPRPNVFRPEATVFGPRKLGGPMVEPDSTKHCAADIVKVGGQIGALVFGGWASFKASVPKIERQELGGPSSKTDPPAPVFGQMLGPDLTDDERLAGPVQRADLGPAAIRLYQQICTVRMIGRSLDFDRIPKARLGNGFAKIIRLAGNKSNPSRNLKPVYLRQRIEEIRFLNSKDSSRVIEYGNAPLGPVLQSVQRLTVPPRFDAEIDDAAQAPCRDKRLRREPVHLMLRIEAVQGLRQQAHLVWHLNFRRSALINDCRRKPVVRNALCQNYAFGCLAHRPLNTAVAVPF